MVLRKKAIHSALDKYVTRNPDMFRGWTAEVNTGPHHLPGHVYLICRRHGLSVAADPELVKGSSDCIEITSFLTDFALGVYDINGCTDMIFRDNQKDRHLSN